MTPQSDRDAWLKVRCGKASASRMADITARTKTGYSASRANYAAELVCERLTGASAESYTNAAMQWGLEKEPEALAAYELLYDVTCEPAAWIDHPQLAMSGATPDGFVGDAGLIEIKCPNSATHIETLQTERIAEKYVKQMQWQMACAGRQWTDYVSFDPRLPEPMRLFVKRVARDEAMIAELTREAESFLAEVAATVENLRRRYG
jgi:putative phage-type endonuclease